MADPPLHAIEGFGPPGPAETRWVAGAGGLRLRTALFRVEAPKGSVVLNTGRTEFIEKYYEVIGELLQRGFQVLVHDWRGQGLSDRLLPDPLKGHAQGWAPFLDDFDQVLAAYAAELPEPWIVVGHSMGGALSLLHMLERGPRFRAAALSSPMLGVNLQENWPPLVRASILGRRLLGRLDDYVTAPGPPPWADAYSDDNTVTHDRVRFARTVALLAAHHDLALGGATWGWLDFALAASARICGHPQAAELSIPLHVVAAGQEMLADTEATRAFCARVPGAEFVEAAGAKHEILMEAPPVRELFWSAFDRAAAATGC
jgi:lysophospholipase